LFFLVLVLVLLVAVVVRPLADRAGGEAGVDVAVGSEKRVTKGRAVAERSMENISQGST
jgi:hypothetical protein